MAIGSVQSTGGTTDYRAQYDTYWSKDDRIGESSSDLEQTADQIVMSCGIARTLDIGSGEGALVASLLRRGVNAYGLDVSAVVVSRCNQRLGSRFTHGTVLALPFPEDFFQTVVSTDCMEHLAPNDVPQALKEIHRVAGRFVFLKLSTTHDRDHHWHLTVEGRAWWEARCFEAGFRKHPAYYRIIPYESLNLEGWQIVIPLEKIPASALSRFPLAALREGRDLHMDMLREHGSRSDAHVARYHFACGYVRPGDRVLDAACGLGYGSHVVRNLTKCSTITGIDGSPYGVEYANANFSRDNTIRFTQGSLPDCLQHIPDNSVDCVTCFETLEHVEAPLALLAEFHRILTPGGRLIASVPHDWSDETGRDPNPFHLHVYDRSRFISELAQSFEVEHLVGQTADRIKGPGKVFEWVSRPRSFANLPPLAENPPVEAEWLLAVVCKSPLNGADVPYLEKVFTEGEQAASGNALAFARDYENPWLVRALVSIGLRTENRSLRERWALETIRMTTVSSADYGAALCVLAYLALEGSASFTGFDLVEAVDRFVSLAPVANPNVLRWQVSLTHVRGLMEMAQGHGNAARQYFQRVTTLPAASYSPTLLTKSAEAAYLQGLLHAADGELGDAESVWKGAFHELQKGIGKRLAAPYPELPARFELREIAASLSLMERLVAAANNVKRLDFQPIVFHDEVNSDVAAKLPWLTAQRETWESAAADRDKSIIALQEQVQGLLAGNAWLTNQREEAEAQSAARLTQIQDMTGWTDHLVKGLAWHEEQRRSLSDHVDGLVRGSEAQAVSIRRLQEGIDWLGSQLSSASELSESRRQQIHEMEAWIERLLQGLAWHQQQRQLLDGQVQHFVDCQRTLESRIFGEVAQNQTLVSESNLLRSELTRLNAEGRELNRLVASLSQELGMVYRPKVVLQKLVERLAGYFRARN